MSNRKHFRKFSPEVAISGSVIPSTIAFNLNVGKTDIYRMKHGQAFFVIKSTLSDGVNTANAPANDTCRAWNWPAAIFSTAREKWNNGTVTIVNDFARTDSILKRQKYSDSYLSTVGELMALNSDTDRRTETTSFRTVDTIFVPDCLSSFQNDLQPGTNLRIELDVPQNAYKKACVYSSGANRDEGAGQYYKFDISDIDLYVLVEENVADTLRSTTYHYNMLEYKTQKKPIINAQVVNETIRVEPSVLTVMYGLQEQGSGSDTRYTPTDFKTASYNALENQYIVFNGINYPENMNDCKFTAAVQETGFKLSAYMNLLYSGLAWNGSGYEGYTKFKTERGRFYTYDLEKDASVQATDLQIKLKFGASQNVDLYTVSVNSFKLTVSYDEFGNMLGTPIKDIV